MYICVGHSDHCKFNQEYNEIKVDKIISKRKADNIFLF